MEHKNLLKKLSITATLFLSLCLTANIHANDELPPELERGLGILEIASVASSAGASTILFGFEVGATSVGVYFLAGPASTIVGLTSGIFFLSSAQGQVERSELTSEEIEAVNLMELEMLKEDAWTYLNTDFISERLESFHDFITENFSSAIAGEKSSLSIEQISQSLTELRFL